MFQRPTLSVYFYLFIFLGLLSYLVFFDHRIEGTKEAEANATRLFNLENVEPIGLEITNRHGSFVFRKTGDHWEIKNPVVALADTATVEQVINQIRLADVQKNIPMDSSTQEGESNLKAWGLSQPEERVIIHAVNDKNFELLIGRNVAINDSIYTRVAARKTEPVKVVSSALKTVVDKDLSAFRSRNVFDFNPEKVMAVSSQIKNMGVTPLQSCELVKKDDAWSLQKPLFVRAESPSVDSLLGQILGLRVVNFVTDDASNPLDYGLTVPRATLGVTLQSGEEIILQIGGPVPNNPTLVYAQRLKSNSIFTLTQASEEDLLRALPNVRDRHIFGFNPNTTTRLRYQYQDKKLSVQKQQTLWTVTGNDKALVDPTQIRTLLKKLSELETTPVIKDSPGDLNAYGLAKPLGKISVEDSQLKPTTLDLKIGKGENKLVYVSNSAEPFVYTLDATALDFLPKDDLAMRDKQVLQLNFKNIRSLTFTTAAGKSATLNRSEKGT